MLSSHDKEDFEEAKPYITGIVALLFKLRFGYARDVCFNEAEGFVKEFTDRY